MPNSSLSRMTTIPAPVRAGRRGYPLTKLASAVASTVATVLLAPVAIFIAHGQKILLAVILIDIPLNMGAHLFYSADAAAEGAVSGIEISLTTIALLLLYTLWAVRRPTTSELRFAVSWRTALPLGLYLAFEAVSAVAARNVIYSLYEIALTAQLFLLYVYLINWVRTRKDLIFVLRMLMIGLLLEGFIMCALSATRYQFDMHTLHTYVGDETGFTRVGGTLVSPNDAAQYLSMTLAVTLALLLFAKIRLRYRLLALAASGIGAIALFLTYSRGGWLAFLCAVFFLLIAGWRRVSAFSKVMAGLLCVAVLACIILPTPVSHRVFGNDEGSAASRIVLAKVAWHMIEAHPLFGVGADNFTLEMSRYANGNLIGEWLYAAHNKYLLIWSETGIGGLLAFLWFVGATVRRAWGQWKFKDRLYSPVAFGILAATCAMLITLLFEPDRGRTFLQLFVVLSSMVVGMGKPYRPGQLNAEHADRATLV